MLKTVNDMYNYSKGSNIPLLADSRFPFWLPYVIDHEKYDRAFRRLYKSFAYFMQDEDDDVSNVTQEFKDEVESLLLLNEKKYSELFRVFSLYDSEYKFLDNYDVTETMQKNGSVVNGARHDATSYGARTDKNTYGSRTDNSTIGGVSDSETTALGLEKTDTTNMVSPFDGNDYANRDMSSTVKDAVTNTVNSIKGQRDDSVTKGEQEDTLVVGEQSSSTDVGEQSNSSSESYTLTRRGNIGVQTSTDMITRFNSFWNGYEFYSIIFKDIARELLSITDDLDV